MPISSPSKLPQIPLSVQWIGGADGFLRLLDQTLLPTQQHYVDCRDVQSVWQAIKSLQVRGAPAIGIAAAYGVVLARSSVDSPTDHVQVYRQASTYLATSRPTAVNLFWAIERMQRVLDGWEAKSGGLLCELQNALLEEARSIHLQDIHMCQEIGRWGADLIPDGATVITHCNAGGLATSEYGTALSILFTAADQGKKLNVYVDETRPLWQGARLTAFELHAAGIPATIICDSMAAHLMQTQTIDAVVVGADRITRRGDVANKIGTYALAVVAKHHGVPFFVAAPSSTFDMQLLHGSEIPIELRNSAEITQPYGIQLAPEGVPAFNPAFDVTPAELITAIVTERGVIRPVDELSIHSMMA